MTPWLVLKWGVLSAAASSAVAALEWNASEIVLVVAAVLAGVATWRAGTGSVWRSNYEGMKAERDELRAQLTECRSQLATAEKRPDVDSIVKELKSVRSDQAEAWGQFATQLQELIRLSGLSDKQKE